MHLKPCIIVHHGGEWVQDEGQLIYNGGRVNTFDDIPEDVDSVYVKQVIDSLGYKDIVKLHFLDHRKDFQSGIRFLGFDNRCCDLFLSLLLEFRVIEVYTEHEDAHVPAHIGFGVGGHGSFVELLNSGVPRSTDPFIDYDTEGSDEDDAEIVNARRILNEETQKQKSYEDELVMLRKVADSKGANPSRYASDFERDSGTESPYESSDEDDCGYLVHPEGNTHKTVKGGSEGSCSKFFVGQSFENSVTFKKAVTDYCIQSGRDIHFSRNDKNRVGGHCKSKDKGCPWRIWASWEKGKRNFMVKTYVGEHTCGRAPTSKRVTAEWVARFFQTKFKVNPYIKVHDIIETVWLEKGLKVSRYLAFRARKLGQKLIVGEYEDQFGLLPRYAAEILRSNRANTVKLKMNANVFERMYLCFEALRKGFLDGCRRIISLDGCFLKGPFGGQLLVAVGRDGNNQMFPIAWAVVEVESTDSWTWFLELLGSDLGTQGGAGYTFMSDQQKGLLAAVANTFPEAVTRVCARHVYCNFRSVFGGGLEFRKQFWKIAKSTTENEFIANIELMRAISEDAADDLMNRNYKKWCRAFYTPLSCCDSVDNNMSEVFNAYILNSRHKPIITMLEDIREGVMERLHKKRDQIANKDMVLCPRIQQKLEKCKVWARGWNAYWDGGFCYGVREGATQDKFVVNLAQRTCSCRTWQISGIPCKHVVVAVWNKADRPEPYVNEYFTKSTYLKAYQHLLEPLNGPQEWPLSNDLVLPPKLKKINHRPKTKRRMQAAEVTAAGKLKRKGGVITCSLCGVQGHNARGCKNVAAEHRSNNNSRNNNNSTTATTTAAHEQQLPMHMRGVGLYTYPNGFQRVATMQGHLHQQNPIPAPTTQQVHRAFYSDYDGEQTVYSCSQECPPSSQQSQHDPTTITSQALQDLAKKRRTTKNN